MKGLIQKLLGFGNSQQKAVQTTPTTKPISSKDKEQERFL